MIFNPVVQHRVITYCGYMGNDAISRKKHSKDEMCPVYLTSQLREKMDQGRIVFGRFAGVNCQSMKTSAYSIRQSI